MAETENQEKKKAPEEKEKLMGTLFSAIALSVIYIAPSIYIIIKGEYDFLSTVIVSICAFILLFIAIGFKLFLPMLKKG
ncbi:MAG: hypothetical protein HQL32_11555 [Planctomycetes bacterium]|nr:hypothetical protein [Planctomycetota bacterium]